MTRYWPVTGVEQASLIVLCPYIPGYVVKDAHRVFAAGLEVAGVSPTRTSPK